MHTEVNFGIRGRYKIRTCDPFRVREVRYLCANRPGLRADRPNRFSQPNLRADNGTRTRGLNLGKVALYQLSYVRNVTLTGNRGIHYPTACTNGTKIATRLKFRGIGHRSLLLTGSPPQKKWYSADSSGGCNTWCFWCCCLGFLG